MSLGSGVIPLDWYSKSEQKKLENLDRLYQLVLFRVEKHESSLTHYVNQSTLDKIEKLRSEIGFTYVRPGNARTNQTRKTI